MAKRKQKNQGIAGLPELDIMASGPDGGMRMFMQYLLDSHVLADEPEFIDFRFDPAKALASAEKTHKNMPAHSEQPRKKAAKNLNFFKMICV